MRVLVLLSVLYYAFSIKVFLGGGGSAEEPSSSTSSSSSTLLVGQAQVNPFVMVL